MLIALSEQCTIFAPGNERHLHRLLYAVASRWHIVAHPAPNRMRELVPSHVWSVYGEIVTQAYKSVANSRQTLVSHSDCGMCDPEKIASFYTLPSLLVVENAHTDGKWIRLVAEKLRPSVGRCFTGKQPMIQVAHAGGIGEIPKELRRHAQGYLNVRPSGKIPLRVVALCDSDAKEPGRPSPQAKEVRAAAEEIGAAAHMLNKRTIENYVPDNSLRDYARLRSDRAAVVRKIISLQRPARDHYPMKSGLTAAERDAFTARYPGGIELNAGLGDFMPDLLENLYHTVERQGLMERDGSGELDRLLDELERNL